MGRRGRLLVLGTAAVGLAGAAASCSPLYVLRAGWAEARILTARRPIEDVIVDPDTDERTRGKLTFARLARAFAAEELGLDVGDSYATYVRLDRDTLAMVLSAAEKDRLTAKTWWFPVVGRVPYRGFFDPADALEEQRKLEEEGYDTYLRPTSAFSTLGWFADPLMSTALRQDEIGVVQTLLHELSHAHLWVAGSVGFNESFATFVGDAGAAAFFCADAGELETVRCARAKRRWSDAMKFSVFLDDLVAELERVYDDAALTRQERLSARERVFADALARFATEVRPTFEARTYAGFAQTLLNNATLLARMRYYRRLPDFQALLDDHGGDLRSAVAWIATRAPELADPFDVLRQPDRPLGAQEGRLPSSPEALGGRAIRRRLGRRRGRRRAGRRLARRLPSTVPGPRDGRLGLETAPRDRAASRSFGLFSGSPP